MGMKILRWLQEQNCKRPQRMLSFSKVPISSWFLGSMAKHSLDAILCSGCFVNPLLYNSLLLFYTLSHRTGEH